MRPAWKRVRRRAWWCRRVRHKGCRPSPGRRSLHARCAAPTDKAFAIAGEENLPGGVVASGAGTGEGKLIDTQCEQKSTGLGVGRSRRQVLGGYVAKNRSK